MRILLLCLFVLPLFVFAQTEAEKYHIILNDNRDLTIDKVLRKDKAKYVVLIDKQYYMINYDNIKSVSPWLEGLPKKKELTAGGLLSSGASSVMGGMTIGILGTAAAFILPRFLSSSSNVPTYIGLGAGVVSLGFTIDGFSKMYKAGKFMDAKVY